MIKKLSFLLFTITAVALFSSMVPGKPGDTWWYVRGEPYYWYYQPDVFAFLTVDQKRWTETLDTDCVKYLYYREMHHDKMNIVYFKPGCTEAEKDAVKDGIRASQWFEADFPVITLFPHLSFDAAAWFVMDDMLLVNFNPDSINEPRFNQFKNEYALEQINFPDAVFPQGISTYIFEFDAGKLKPASAIDLAKIIYRQDSGLVANVQPNLINAYEEVSDENIDVVSNRGADLINDNVEYYLINQDNKTVKLFVKYKADVPVTYIKIYDLFGREVYRLKATSKEIKREIIISDYVGGIYFASIENERGKVLGVQRFVKI